MILYKSTLQHRQQKERQNGSPPRNGKNGNSNKPNLDKKSIKSDVEHLAIWIIRNYGERQRDDSYHFVLNKDLYQNKLAEMIRGYIDEYTIHVDDEGANEDSDEYNEIP